MMRTWIKIIVSAILGFFSSILILKGFEINFDPYVDEFVIAIFIIIVIVMGVSFGLYKQIISLNNKDVDGEEEDAIDIQIYKKLSDYALLTFSNFIFSLLALCITLITNKEIVIIILSLITVLICCILMSIMMNLYRLVQPHRPIIPRSSHKDYGNALLNVADDGEKHVMLIGFYKSYHLFCTALLIAIMFATFYSISSGNSQIFSIIAMSIVLVLANGKYYLSIRNK
ncbi:MULTISPECIES: DUF3169 domain-containing protein [Bacillaceae]|uniref:DUF3169 domain-containing protein n=1 Tax=Bacillaceae TaxID=186817 RepID=UPI001E4D75F9|nr:DUF3169 domain-containing protein [Bacillus sp. Au-Bac7]MCE4048873.1 DUF3169 domain-containing protein [Bacillus sp. Au-Bac7]